MISRAAETESTAQTLGLATRLSQPHPGQQPRSSDTGIQEGEPAILVCRTLRSRFKLDHPGRVSILGVAKPGMELIARGVAIVWSHLGGMVHAGAQGDE